MGVGDAKQDSKLLDAAAEQLATIAGQKPSIRRARKSIAQFKVREGMPVGVSVTLRGDRAYEFLDRLISVSLPRVRDFRGLKPDGVRRPRQLLDGHARADHLPRDRLRRHRPGAGPGHRHHHDAKSNAETYALLEAFGMPFSREGDPYVNADGRPQES